MHAGLDMTSMCTFILEAGLIFVVNYCKACKEKKDGPDSNHHFQLTLANSAVRLQLQMFEL